MVKNKQKIFVAMLLCLLIGLVSGVQAEGDGKININTATVEQLTAITGIGPSIAQRIVDYRQENGQFTSIDEIVNVRGIGAKTFEKIKAYITAEG